MGNSLLNSFLTCSSAFIKKSGADGSLGDVYCLGMDSALSILDSLSPSFLLNEEVAPAKV